MFRRDLALGIGVVDPAAAGFAALGPAPEAWQAVQSISSDTGSTMSVVASIAPAPSRATRRIIG